MIARLASPDRGSTTLQTCKIINPFSLHTFQLQAHDINQLSCYDIFQL